MIELEASNRYRLDLDPEELQAVAIAASVVLAERVTPVRLMVANTLADLYARALAQEVAVALPVQPGGECAGCDARGEGIEQQPNGDLVCSVCGRLVSTEESVPDEPADDEPELLLVAGYMAVSLPEPDGVEQ